MFPANKEDCEEGEDKEEEEDTVSVSIFTAGSSGGVAVRLLEAV